MAQLAKKTAQPLASIGPRVFSLSVLVRVLRLPVAFIGNNGALCN